MLKTNFITRSLCTATQRWDKVKDKVLLYFLERDRRKKKSVRKLSGVEGKQDRANKQYCKHGSVGEMKYDAKGI
jgi:hypothetical protein